MRNRQKTLFALALILLTAAACQHGQLPNSSPPDETKWDGFVQGFLQRHFEEEPEDAVSAGRHEFDGELPDWSPAGFKRQLDHLTRERAKAVSFTDAQLADPRQRLERDYMLATIDGQVFWLTTAEEPYRNPQFYSGALDPNVYVTREYAPPETRVHAFVKYAHGVPAACAQIRANLRTPLALPLLQQGVLVFKGLASYIDKDAIEAFSVVKDQGLQAELKTAADGAAKSLNELAAWLESQKSTANAPFALGAKRMSQMLEATERVSAPLSVIEEAGREALARDLSALRKICASYAPGQSLRKCMDKEEARKPQDGPVSAAAKILPDLRAFILKKDFVTIPSTDQALVRESPPYMRWNAAFINMPGPYEKDLPSIYYISPPDPNWSAKEQAEYIPGMGTLTTTSVHEVWPGHFLQFLHANRVQSKFGEVFGSYAFIEGWAHYGEELMIAEEGYGDHAPELMIGQLGGALERDVRLLSAIGLHTGKLTQKQAEELFRKKALLDAAGARQQAARGTFDPGYLNYTLGKLMIRKLREDWCATRGGKNAWKAFHDELLSYGAPPIPLLRKAMLGPKDGALF